MGDWKVVLMEQRAQQLMCWFEPFVKLRAPKIFNLRQDPFERADHNSNTYWDWLISHAYIIYEMQGLVAQQIQAFLKFPPRQKPVSFNLDAVLAHLQDASGGGQHQAVAFLCHGGSALAAKAAQRLHPDERAAFYRKASQCTE
jgi:hypothetical protein